MPHIPSRSHAAGLANEVFYCLLHAHYSILISVFKQHELMICWKVWFYAVFWTLLDFTRQKNGGADQDRTDDLLNAIQALSQLSYSPKK